MRELTYVSHPMLLLARRLIEDDSGGLLIGTVYPGERINLLSVLVPEDRWSLQNLLKAEIALRWYAVTRGFNALLEFCTGEQTEQEDAVREHVDVIPGGDLGLAHKFLDDYFNAWSDDDKDAEVTE